MRAEVGRGFVRESVRDNRSYYGWIPHYVNYEDFQNLDVEETVIDQLDSAGKYFKDGEIDKMLLACDSAVKESLRSRFRVAGYVPENQAGLDRIASDLYQRRIIGESTFVRIQAFIKQVLSLQNKENPHDDDYARIVLDTAKSLVKSIYSEIKPRDISNLAPEVGVIYPEKSKIRGELTQCLQRWGY